MSLLPAPKEIVQELNLILVKFLWKGTDKVTRLCTIIENGGLKMIDLASMVKSLRLAWLKIIFGENDGAWKSYLRFAMKRYGGLFLFYCNYDMLLSFFILSYLSGGQISETVMVQKKNGDK